MDAIFFSLRSKVISTFKRSRYPRNRTQNVSHYAQLRLNFFVASLQAFHYTQKVSQRSKYDANLFSLHSNVFTTPKRSPYAQLGRKTILAGLQSYHCIQKISLRSKLDAIFFLLRSNVFTTLEIERKFFLAAVEHYH